MRFNPPPGWPPAPESWHPHEGWQPPPSWPPVPPGWELWVDDLQPGAPGTAKPSDAKRTQGISFTIATNRLVFVASCLLFLLGAFIVFFVRHDANLIASLMTVIGFGIAALQVFMRFPVLPISGTSSQEHSHPAAGDPAGEKREPYPPSRSQQLAQIPAVYGLAFFVSAILTSLGELWLLTAGISPSSQSLNNFVIASVASGLLYAFGLPGFHALQRSTPGGRASLYGCAFAVTGTVIGGLSIWEYAYAFNQGIATPPSFHELAVVSSWVAILADLLLAYAVIRAEIYPRWTAVIMIVNAVLAWIYIQGIDGPVMVTVYRLDNLASCVPLVAFAWYMTRRPNISSKASHG